MAARYTGPTSQAASSLSYITTPASTPTFSRPNLDLDNITPIFQLPRLRVIVPNPFVALNPANILIGSRPGQLAPNPYRNKLTSSATDSMAQNNSDGFNSPKSGNGGRTSVEDEATESSTYTRTFGYGPMPLMPRFADYPVAALLAEKLSSWARGVEDWARVFQGFIVQIEKLLPIYPSNIHYSLEAGFTVSIDVPDSPHARQVLNDALREANSKIRELFSSQGLDLEQSGQWIHSASNPNYLHNPQHGTMYTPYVEDPDYGRGVRIRPGSIPVFFGPNSGEMNVDAATPTPGERGRERALTGYNEEVTVADTKVAKAPRKRGASKKKTAVGDDASTLGVANNGNGTLSSPTLPPKKKRAAPRKKSKAHDAASTMEVARNGTEAQSSPTKKKRGPARKQVKVEAPEDSTLENICGLEADASNFCNMNSSGTNPSDMNENRMADIAVEIAVAAGISSTAVSPTTIIQGDNTVRGIFQESPPIDVLSEAPGKATETEAITQKIQNPTTPALSTQVEQFDMFMRGTGRGTLN